VALEALRAVVPADLAVRLALLRVLAAVRAVLRLAVLAVRVALALVAVADLRAVFRLRVAAAFWPLALVVLLVVAIVIYSLPSWKIVWCRFIEHMFVNRTGRGVTFA
jgi:hypothetical protein